MGIGRTFLTGASSFLLAACQTTPAPAYAPITVTGFECGDNCYLRFTRPGSEAEETALCHAPACVPWAEEQELPPEFVGRSAQVLLGVGEQVNGDGEVMGTDFAAVLDLRF